MKRRLIGTVKSNLPSTLRVEIDRRMKHGKYGKIIRGRTVCHVHDPAGNVRPGDVVEIEEAPPASKLKRWALVRVVSRSAAVEVSE
ncbi:MAG: uS17 family ribosomal protein [Planctomycetota bacterium]